MANDFKSLFMLDPEVTYFNHGAYGGCPEYIFNAMMEWQKTLEQNPSKYMEELYDNLENSRHSLSKFIDCDRDDIVFFNNPTTAMNTIVKSLNLNQGDEILSTDHEYGAMNITWDYICEKTGAKFIRTEIPIPYVSKEHFVHEIEKNITSKTKMIFISHITSSTALIFPAKEICELAKSHNILSFIDGAHAPAQIPLSINEIDPDFYAGACHKWMCSPKGVAFLYTKKVLQDSIDPLIISHGFGKPPKGSKLYSGSNYLNYHQWQGTRDFSNVLTVPKLIQFLNDKDWVNVAKNCHNLALYARNEISNLLDTQPISSNEYIGQMTSIPIDTDDPGKLKAELSKNYKIEVPITSWNKKNLIRISIQAYNTKEDIHKLVDALHEIRSN